jgi:hypothetical protein
MPSRLNSEVCQPTQARGRQHLPVIRIELIEGIRGKKLSYDLLCASMWIIHVGMKTSSRETRNPICARVHQRKRQKL